MGHADITAPSPMFMMRHASLGVLVARLVRACHGQRLPRVPGAPAARQSRS
ncbi:MAG: hypothetical protein KC657_32175 [Myxococcales bacterium]|nr:hypothetical protein [Myxococcales bacterium]